MAFDLEACLNEYDISSSTGFLPQTPALRHLPDAYYDKWEDIISCLPQYIEDKTLRARVDALPVLSTSRLKAKAVWRRAYVVLSFLAQGYIWGRPDQEPNKILPMSIAKPFVDVSSHLGMRPCLTYSSVCLWNSIWGHGSIGSLGYIRPEKIHSINTFTGTRDEEWFYAISGAIEIQGAKVIPWMLSALEAVHHDNTHLVRCLQEIQSCLDSISNTLDRMCENCEPDIFYHSLRPLLTGTADINAGDKPKGVFYVLNRTGGGVWRADVGGSNAQSTLLQLFDVILGVDHLPIENGPRSTYFREIRQYMPRSHRHFLSFIEAKASIRAYVLDNNDLELQAAYNRAVLGLMSFREKHMRIVARYILRPSRSSPSSSSSKPQSGTHVKGTGGTNVVSFLQQTHQNTRAAMYNRKLGPRL